MTRKLKSSARKKRRNIKLFAISLLVVIAVIVGAIFAFAQSNSIGGNANNNRNTNSNQTDSNNGNHNNSTKLEGPLKVRLQTTMGNITIQLRDDKPITAGNFR